MKARMAFVMSLLIIVCAGAAVGQEARPVALAGASYGRHEVKSIIKNVLSASADAQYVYEDLGEALPAADLPRYSLIIVAHSLKEPLAEADSAAFQDYLVGGGHVLLVSSAPRDMAKTLGLEKVAWLGLKRVSWHRNGLPCRVLKPDHPMLKGIFDAKADPLWLKASTAAVVAAPDWANVIGTDAGDCLFGVRPVGKGWVAYVGHELFRLRSPQNEAMLADSDSYVRLMRNVVAASGALTQGAVRQEALAQTAATGRKVLVWEREWQFGEAYGPRFFPPLPEEKELVTSLSADLAVDEYESLQLNITPLEDLGMVSWRMEDGGLPDGKVALYVQERPDPIPWPKAPDLAQEFPFWLMPPRYVEPKGSEDFTAPEKQTRILWIRLNSFGAKPGRYAPVLRLSFAKGETLTIPVHVRVWPATLPRKRLITLSPAGTVYSDANDSAPGERFARNLEEHGFEGAVLNAMRLHTFGIVGEEGKLDSAWFQKNRARFEKEEPPMIDFRSLDPWVEQQIARNLTRLRVGPISDGVVAVTKRAGYDDALQAKAEAWFLREAARYFREKGIRFMVASLGDELSEKELDERFIPWAQRMSAAGWGCSSSFTGLHNLKPEVNARLAPHVNLWTLNRGIAPDFTAKLRSGELKVRPDAVVGTYGAGAGLGIEFRKPLTASRFLGWESWLLGVRNCSPNPYFKGWLYYVDYRTRDMGVGGERFVSFVDRDDPAVPLADSPFLEGIREGMEEGNLCALLSWYLDKMDLVGGEAAATARGVRAELAKVLSDQDGALLRWSESRWGAGYKSVRIEGGIPDYRRAKRRVLELLDAVRPLAEQAIRPSVYWHDVPLVRDGAPAAVLDSDEAGLINARLVELGGVRLPEIPRNSTPPRGAETVIRAGSPDATTAYPGPGGYFIRERVPAGGPREIAIAGPDDAGTQKGVRMFLQFLRVEGAWPAI